jgi:mannose-6-phosphate isomerase-like protein (cupin superfamily)
LLWFENGKKCSWHYHKLKKETFFIQSGLIEVSFSYEDSLQKASKIILLPGDSFEVPVGLRHQMKALKETELFEFSTQHFEDDSYRLEKGD